MAKKACPPLTKEQDHHGKKDRIVATKKDRIVATKKDRIVATKKDRIVATKKDRIVATKKDKTDNATGGFRTLDLGLIRPMLYQLSYNRHRVGLPYRFQNGEPTRQAYTKYSELSLI
jgi:hypothetical protein